MGYEHHNYTPSDFSGQEIQVIDKFGRTLVPCELCSIPTPMSGTKRCDRCWELERRIHMDPELARQILARLDVEKES